MGLFGVYDSCPARSTRSARPPVSSLESSLSSPWGPSGGTGRSRTPVRDRSRSFYVCKEDSGSVVTELLWFCVPRTRRPSARWVTTVVSARTSVPEPSRVRGSVPPSELSPADLPVCLQETRHRVGQTRTGGGGRPSLGTVGVPRRVRTSGPSPSSNRGYLLFPHFFLSRLPRRSGSPTTSGRVHPLPLRVPPPTLLNFEGGHGTHGRGGTEGESEETSLTSFRSYDLSRRVCPGRTLNSSRSQTPVTGDYSGDDTTPLRLPHLTRPRDTFPLQVIYVKKNEIYLYPRVI